MNLFVLNQDFDVLAIVDTYKSLIWTDRFKECGDFELVKSMDLELLQYIKQDNYLWRNDSEHVMIIEKLLIKSDAETGSEITVTGRSLESILDRRIVWGLKILSGNFQDEIEALLNENVISPSKPERKIENFVFEKSTDPTITDLRIEAQYTGDNLYDIITAACADRGVGFKITLNAQKQFVFKLYTGDDRSYDQTVLPYVIFSPNFDNIINSNYMESRSALKNVTLVGGEGEGPARRYTAVGNIGGLSRREIFTDARDLSSDIDEDFSEEFKFTQYSKQVFNNSSKTFVTDANFNSCMVDVSAYAGRTISIDIPKYNIKTGTKTDPETEETVDVGGRSPYATILVDSSKKYISTLQAWEAYDDDPETVNKGNLTAYEIKLPDDAQYIYTSMFSQTAIDNGVFSGELEDFECSVIRLSNDAYISLMRQRGRETINENKEIMSFEGEADTTMMFQYGKDFFTGDIVQVADEFGHEVTARVTEVITSEDESGYTTYPTFESLSEGMGVLPDGYIELDFIRSSGTQYIDTAFKPNSDTRVVMDVESLVDGTFAYFGARNLETAGCFALWQISSTKIRVDYGSSKVEYDVDNTKRRVIIDMNKTDGLFDEVELSTDSETFQGVNGLLLLCQNTNGTADTRMLSAKLYSCRIYDGDTLIRDLVPCKDPNDVVGLYDMVDRKFYGNAGTGAFLSN